MYQEHFKLREAPFLLTPDPEYFYNYTGYQHALIVLLVVWQQTGVFWVGLGSAPVGQNLLQDAVAGSRCALTTKHLGQDLGRYAEKRLQQLN